MEKTEERTFEGLVCKPIEQFGVAFNDIKIPKGWRLPTAQEGIALVNNDEFVKWSRFYDSMHDFYCQQCFKKNEGKTAVWLGCFRDSFYLNSDCELGGTSAFRGVLLVKR